MMSGCKCTACGASLEHPIDAHAAVGRKAKCRACRAGTTPEEEDGHQSVQVVRIDGQPAGGHAGAPAAGHDGDDEAARALSSTARCALWDEDRRARPAWRERLHRRAPAAREEPADSVFAASVGSLELMAGRVCEKRVIRFFVSSTFTDTFFERNWLLEGVRVRLGVLCMRVSCKPVLTPRLVRFDAGTFPCSSLALSLSPGVSLQTACPF